MGSHHLHLEFGKAFDKALPYILNSKLIKYDPYTMTIRWIYNSLENHA